MKTFQTEIALRWGDMDAMAHLNNVIYFRLMEEARIQWFAALGFSTLPAGEAPILAHASCDFLRPLNYPAVAVVRQEVTRVGRSSVDVAVTIEDRATPGLAAATGHTVIVWYDYAAGRSAPWPDSVRARLD